MNMDLAKFYMSEKLQEIQVQIRARASDLSWRYFYHGGSSNGTNI